jgi:ParB family chromosome partitioning protein
MANGAKLSRTDEYGAESRGQTFVYDPDALTLIEDPSHPLYDPSVHQPPPKAFVDGIIEHGVLKPICIRRNGTDKSGRAIVEVVDGRMRVKGARLANIELRKLGQPTISIPAVLQKGLGTAEAESVMILLNEHQRVEDLVTRAEKLKRYLTHGHSEQQARMHFGMRSRGFTQLMQIIEMSEPVRAALRAKKVTFEIAVKLSALPEAKQAAALEAVLTEGGGKGRGEKAKDAADKHAGTKSKKIARVRPAGVVLKAVENVQCMPGSDYQAGAMAVLNWILGKGDPPAWAPKNAEKKGKKAGK